jgi:eukaryotic-like serine/threonine-protein kinase
VTTSRWQRVEDLYHRAASLPLAEQDAFLTDACAGDPTLAEEVRGLLAHSGADSGFLETTAIEMLAESIADEGDESALLLPGSTVSHYRVLGVLGRGGMGIVHKAEDLRLGRPVALKLLPNYLSDDPRALDRFEREARAASALNHPGICTVYEIDQAGPHHFIAIEFLDGENLKERLARGALESRNALRIALDVCDALEAAHAVGIVHRDIKPANIFLTRGGATKVLDFGAAKRLSGEPAEPAGTLAQEDPPAAQDRHLTMPGTALGTLDYMSPEQAARQAVDARSDIYSLGAVIFEMVTGRLPPVECKSSGESGATDAIPPGLPRQLLDIAHRCLKANPAGRYPSISALRDDLARLAPAVARPGAVSRYLVAAIAIVSVLAIFAGIAWRAQRIEATAGATRVSTSRAIRSIAVLPFRDAVGDPAQAFFAEGITKALIEELSRIATLQVISSSSSQQYGDTRKSFAQIARELQVQALIEGTVARDGDRIRVSAKLVDATKDQKLWSADYNRASSDVIRLQKDIVQAVSTAIAGTLSPVDQARLAAGARSVDPAAYEAYLKGVYFFAKGTHSAFGKAQGYYEKAIALDPGFAPAYTGLAETLSYQAFTGSLPPAAWSKSEELLAHALSLDPDSVLAHTLVGMIRFHYHCDRPGAERELDRALEINPGDMDALTYHSFFLLEVGRTDEAIAEKTRVVRSDPLSIGTQAELGMYYVRAGRYEEAIEQLQHALELEENEPYTLSVLAGAQIELGRYDEAVVNLEKAVAVDRAPRWLGNLGFAYARAGRRDDALAVATELARTYEHQYVPAFRIARIYAVLGQREQALAWLRKTRKGEHQLAMEPGFESLQKDPEFLAIQAQTNPPEGCPAF